MSKDNLVFAPMVFKLYWRLDFLSLKIKYCIICLKLNHFPKQLAAFLSLNMNKV